MNIYEQTVLLKNSTLNLIDESRKPIRQIAIGSGVGYEWLIKFSKHGIKEPSIRKMQKVHEFLENK